MDDKKKITLVQVPVVFDQAAHTYTNTDTGVMLKGITSTLLNRVFPDKYKGIPEAVLKKAAERGSMVHEEIELAESIGIEPTTREAQDWLTLKAENGLTYLTGEYLVSDLEHYATAIDAVLDNGDGSVDLADFKTTSKLDKASVSWQLSICALFFELNNPGVKVVRLLAVWLRDGIRELVEVERKENKEVMRLIQADQAGEDFVVEEPFPEYFREREALLESLTRRIKEMSAEADEIKTELLEQMAEKGDKQFDTGGMLVTYVAPSKSSRFDSTRFKKEHSDLYALYQKESETKATLKITLR